jgi:MYXO-CTERM domain-containing protein
MVELRRSLGPRAVAVALGLGGLALCTPDARACSPPSPEPSESCLRVSVWVPGARFPLNFTDGQIRIWFDVQEGYPRELPVEPTIPDRPPELVVARETREGFEVVGHTFTDDGFQLSDPVAGRYVFASTDQTCPAKPAEFAAGGVVADFELTPAVALPAELGVATFTGRTVPSEEVVVGTAADCSPVIEVDNKPRYHFELELDEQTVPWRDALRIGVEVDGELVYGFGPGNFVGPSTMAFEYRDFCDGGEYSLSPGIRELAFVGRLEPDTITVRSSLASFDCEEAPRPEPVLDAGGTPDAEQMEPAPGEPSPSGASPERTKAPEMQGCSVGHAAHGDAWSKFLPLALLGALGAAWRRRRA